jgi:hypothetical protein
VEHCPRHIGRGTKRGLDRRSLSSQSSLVTLEASADGELRPTGRRGGAVDCQRRGAPDPLVRVTGEADLAQASIRQCLLTETLT